MICKSNRVVSGYVRFYGSNGESKVYHVKNVNEGILKERAEKKMVETPAVTRYNICIEKVHGFNKVKVETKPKTTRKTVTQKRDELTTKLMELKPLMRYIKTEVQFTAFLKTIDKLINSSQFGSKESKVS